MPECDDADDVPTVNVCSSVWTRACEDEIETCNVRNNDDDDGRVCAVENDTGTMKMDDPSMAVDIARMVDVVDRR